MKINWKVRLRQKEFLVALIAALFLVVQSIATALGYEWEITQEWHTAFNAVLGLLVLTGVVIDPTTEKVGDSKQAQAYSKPKKDWEGK